MVTDVITIDADFAAARKALWDFFMDPQTYSRMFLGIGDCERAETSDTHPVLLFRARHAGTELTVPALRLVVGKELETFELQCPGLGSFAAIRLRGDEEQSRITITYFGASRIHPWLAERDNAEVIAWTMAGLERIVDAIVGAPTSVLVNGEESAARQQVGTMKQMVATGVVRTFRPDRALKQVGGLARWGFTLAGGYAAAAGHSPNRLAVIDEVSAYTFGQMHDRTHELASALSMLGIGARDKVGLLSRNRVAMVECMVATGKLGVDTVLLNTGLSARQIEDVADRHGLSAVFLDDEYDELIRYLPAGVPRFATGQESVFERYTVDDLIALDAPTFSRPSHPGRLIVLTSGTSGTPKSAQRPQPKGFGTVAALLSRIPLRMDETMMIPAPLFHTWGLAALQISTPIRASVVLPERFDAEDCLRLIEEHAVTSLIVVPVMVNRILDLPKHIRDRYDTSSLRIVASCGAPLAGPTVLRFMDTFGDVLYNVYGSTEVSWATIADPADLRAAPATAGRPPLGTKIAVLDQDLRPVPRGVTGRIFVLNHMLFDGYTDAKPPTESGGMLDTGDLGYLDADGLLFVAGRDDEMIISGGENVFPRPVEEALSHLPQVSEVAVVGVPDKEYGQRLAAFVVTREGFGLDRDMVRNYIRHRLSRFSVPRDVTFLEALPRNATGKILKRTLIQPS
ncbi:acyl-CoA synthetase (AMP-forming)/AMP-acid ligase II [Nocardia tenerifensis]|uniref:Acyl-CoA synthetase (AMP-forming)/AMP-acid ligase II n=1 Tax=Nocardia tenerifensis TaxID=228006 RepID=A0A318KDQ6_9NOCA|nr:AMP-binding protein [Nocardia tenerifensis]PXX57443.1 acyl-CoA synthetase (AMP-forming)/AMP-acid ligase II [Nocardia tenerifensis]